MSAMRILLAMILFTAAAVATADAASARTLQVGTECTYPPFNYRDETGALLGYDVDVARTLGERIDRKIEFICQEWDGMIPALLEFKYHLIAASLSITEKRQEAIGFSLPYRSALGRFVAAKQSELVPFGEDGALDTAAFAGLRIGVLSHSVYHNWIKARLPQTTIAAHDNSDALQLALQAGEVDAILTNPTTAHLGFLSAEGSGDYDFIGPAFADPEFFGNGFGLGIHKSRDTLLEEINEALADMVADGTLTALSQRYFPFDIAPRN